MDEVILGIHDGHNSGATILVDGKIEASVSEERLTRVKNEVGYPTHSIEEVLCIAKVKPCDLTRVVFASNYMHTAEHLKGAEEWYRAGVGDRSVEPTEALKANLDRRRKERVNQLVEHLGVPEKSISFVDHHAAHAAAAYYGSAFSLHDPVLILTCDGSGDGVSSTVSIGQNGNIERVAFTGREASLGKIYSRVTYHLGLTPWEHEYKVMGLAPYAYQNKAAELSNVFKNLVKLSDDGLTFNAVNNAHTNFLYDYLRANLERRRFDEVAGAIQIYTEEMLCAWVTQCIEKTGISRLACGGGVFMNVKANMRIAQLDCVESMTVFPSCGDESLSFGAVWMEYYRHISESRSKPQNEKVFLSDIYLGSEFSSEQIEDAIDEVIPGTDCTISRHENIEEEIARLLSIDMVVARFAGRMEWGARALGNRSILANPRSWSNVEKINSMIKMRDFWMPFAPSMLAEDQERYILNPKKLSSPYMMFAFETLPLASKHLGAAIHPRDRTARAQLVEKSVNPRYHRLIKEFKNLTGQSAVLNTSFNLHGFPLVRSPADALDVFLRSGLDFLALDNYLISKPAHSSAVK